MSDITSQPDPPGRPHAGVTLAPPPAPGDPDSPPPRPFPLHPNFWYAVLWCVFLVLMSQVPGAIAGLVVMVVLALKNDEALKDMSSPAVGAGVVAGVVVAHGLIILLSLLVLRVVVAGRDWAREVALRLPSAGHVLLALAMLPAFMVLGSAVDQFLKRAVAYPGLDRPASVGAFWAALVLALLVIALGHLACRVAGGRDWHRTWVGPRPASTKWALSAALLAFFVGLTAAGYHLLLPLSAEVLPDRAEMSSMEDMVKVFTSIPPAVAVVVIGLFPGLSEELWCRAFLGRGLVGKYGLFWGVLLTSFLFGAIHGDPRQGTMALFMGAVLHASYLASRSLLVPILLHFLNNSLAVTLARLPDVSKLEETPGSIPWPLLACAAVLLAACLFAFWQSRARLVGPWRPGYPGVACPPPDSETSIVAPRPSWLALGLVALTLAGFAASFALALR